MKVSNLIYAGAGYVLGTQARLDQFAAHARRAVFAKLGGSQPERASAGMNGYQR